MARRYRYAIIKKKEAAKGKLSVGLAIASLLLFGGAVGIAYVLEGSYGFIVGGICLFAALLSVYGYQAYSHYHDGNSLFIHQPMTEGSMAENIMESLW